MLFIFKQRELFSEEKALPALVGPTRENVVPHSLNNQQYIVRGAWGWGAWGGNYGALFEDDTFFLLLKKGFKNITTLLKQGETLKVYSPFYVERCFNRNLNTKTILLYLLSVFYWTLLVSL